MTGVATVAALGAALLFAVSSALQHRTTLDTPAPDGFHGRAVAAFVRRTVTHPLWLFGGVCDAAGLGLHALAVHDGPLTLVQPLLVAGLVFALPLRRLIDHRRANRRELATAAVLAGGLVTFLVAATPPGDPVSGADPIPAAVTAAVAVAVVSLCVRLGRRGTGTVAAGALGVGTGLAFAVVAALLKATTDALARGPVAALTSWPLYGLAVVGVASLVMNQLAFQAGPLAASLPAISIVDPIASVVIGIAVYDERLRTGVGATGAAIAGLLIVIVAGYSLSNLAHAERSYALPRQGR